MIRSFVAIDLPDTLKAALQDVAAQLRARVPPNTIRWGRVQGIHLTLQFLGNVAESDLAGIEAALAEVARRHRPFTFEAAGLGCFPNLRRPRVVWVGVREETGALLALQRDVERALKPLGFKPERRAFHPHLTLGRLGRRASSADQQQIGAVVREADVGLLGRVAVDTFRLMRSDLRPNGAVYTPLATFELAGEA